MQCSTICGRCYFNNAISRISHSARLGISGYVKNGTTKDSGRVFNMPQRGIFSWTTMIHFYLQQGIISEAESLFRQMLQNNVCASTLQGRVADAWKIFDEMPRRPLTTWTTLMAGYARNRRIEIAHKLFVVMLEKVEAALTAMLMGYVKCGRLENAIKLFKIITHYSIDVYNEILHGLGQKGKVSDARSLFYAKKKKNNGTWNIMIQVYKRNGCKLEVLDTFRCIQRVRVKTHYADLVTILGVSSSMTHLNHGKEIHAKVVRLGFDTIRYVALTLMNMYFKCADLIGAVTVFQNFSLKDVVMWNTMISGYAQHGLGEDALQVFSEMCAIGFLPNDSTFVSVLLACRHTGKVNEGKKFFKLRVPDYKLEPKIQHYACVVDLLGRPGHINEAMNFIQNMPIAPNVVVWSSILAACKTHNNVEFAEIAALQLRRLDPKNSDSYVLLSQIYASMNRWEDVWQITDEMKSSKVWKSPGYSWINVEK